MRALQLAIRTALRSSNDLTPSASKWALNYRQLSSCSILMGKDKSKEDKSPEKQQKDGSAPAGSWLNWFGAARFEPAKDAHSKLLADSRAVYELQTHDVIPQESDKYHNLYIEHVPRLLQKGYGIELVGSWRVGIGDEDQFVHMWKYPGGYAQVSKFLDALRNDKYMGEFNQKLQQCLRSRNTELYQKFSFWDEPQPRQSKHMYEMRTYRLKPGTMIEWGNYWARGIQIRRKSYEPVTGMFSQIGQLYIVRHIWAYKDLESRKEVREAAWQIPGWEDIVQNTVPLIRQMDSKIMLPMPYSPLQ